MSLEMTFIQLRIPDMIRLHLVELGSLRLNLIKYEKSIFNFAKPDIKPFYCFFNF